MTRMPAARYAKSGDASTGAPHNASF